MDNQKGTSQDTTSPVSPDLTVPARHPIALWFFFWGEFAERSSYYGMRAILFLYLTKALHYSDTDASPIYSAFKMACYFLPLLGGYIADRWLGRYWTIVGFSVPYVLGHFILGIPTEFALIVALALLAGGSGVIKPNISTLMGQTYDQQRPGQERLRSAAFLWFYFAINVGALLSQVAMPELRSYYIQTHLAPEVQAQADIAAANGEDISKFATGEVVQAAYAFAFLFPAWLMVGSLAIFAAGKRYYATEMVQRQELTPEERKLQWQTLARLFSIFALVVVFWVGYEHNDTLWIAFIRDYVNLQVPGLSKPISPDQLQFLNALFVIILVPTFNIVFGRLDPNVKIFTPMRKILAGFLFTAAAIGIMSAAGFLAQGHTQQVIESGKTLEVSTVKLSVIWPALAYIVLTFGEVLLYGTMLELAYTAAPKSMKGFITACFLVTNTLGNFINVVWTPLYGGSLEDAVNQRGPLMPGQFFGITAFVVVLAAIAFIFIGKRFERGQAAQVQLPNMDSVESLCNNLARSKLLAPDAVRTIRQRWLNEARAGADDPSVFSKWLVINGFLTDFQLGVLQRGFAELLFLDDYKLLERIGQGRMAGVYKAVHKHGQVVAVKVLPLAKSKDAKAAARFQRESRMALRLKHPNCVRTFQVGTTQSGLHYIVMEYLDGNTLGEVLKQRGKLPMREALHVAMQTLRGLIHIDAEGLVHRDLKPANLMLAPTAGETVLRSQVKILDIGLGRALVEEGEIDELTAEGTLLGTPLYMAPEQAKSAHTADIRADIYSLGCVLYQALTEQPPFADNNALMQMLRHASESPKPLSAWVPDVAPAVQAVMDKLLAKNPAQRFSTPTEALAALESLGQRAPAPLAAETPMPAYLRWLEQQAPVENEPPPPAAVPATTNPQVAKSPAFEYVGVPMVKPLPTTARLPVVQELSTAQLARRRSLAAILVALIVLLIAAMVWGALTYSSWFNEFF